MTADAMLFERLSADQANAKSDALLTRLLAEQQQLTAVEEFALRKNDAPHATRYQRLLPASPPAEGQQYAFEVDLDRCSGCKACVAACHNLNGLDDREAWRDVGLLIGGTSQLPIVQHVTTACHHCLSPACLAACPVNAYEKDPITGIVKHLDDQCFGCQYCTLACPYDVPKYHPGKGIVRKCDMCSTRIALGEAPACAQACPNQAIAIRVVSKDQIVEDAEASVFLPGAPDSQITYPTTTFKTKRVFPRNMLPADYFQVSQQHPHWPLVVMLVLTQLSVGAFAWSFLVEPFFGQELANAVKPIQATTALVFALVALTASVFHLGRPQYAFRAVLGLCHSWLSREIVLFGGFAGLATAYASLLLAPEQLTVSREAARTTGLAVVLLGAAAVFCSVMIYASLRREFWSFHATTFRFAATSSLLGLAVLWITQCGLALFNSTPEAIGVLARTGPPVCWMILGVMSAKLLWEASVLRHLLSRSVTPLKRSALLMTRELATPTLARFGLGALGGIVAPALLLRMFSSPTFSSAKAEWVFATLLLFGGTLAGELIERYLFFAAVASPRMPGGIR